jgi:hypothetical protein
MVDRTAPIYGTDLATAVLWVNLGRAPDCPLSGPRRLDRLVSHGSHSPGVCFNFSFENTGETKAGPIAS